MDVRCSAALAAAPEAAFAVVVDLSTYPQWLRIVSAAVPVDPGVDGAPAWAVDLAGRLGPFTRTKRVRMVRSVADAAGTTVRFERREEDGREHSPWVLSASIERRSGGGSTLSVHIHYGGTAWLPGVDRLLGLEARAAAPRLDAVVAAMGADRDH